MSVNIDKSIDSLVVKFNYSPERIAKIKTICGCKWDASEKTWKMPYTEENPEVLKKLYKNERIDIKFQQSPENDKAINKLEELQN